MLHVEVARLWSRGIIQLFTDSKAQYDPETNSLTKLGRNLKVGDSILRRVDQEGRQRRVYYTWRVVELSYKEALSIDELKVGREYGIFVSATQTVGAFKLEGVNLETKVGLRGCNLNIDFELATQSFLAHSTDVFVPIPRS